MITLNFQKWKYAINYPVETKKWAIMIRRERLLHKGYKWTPFVDTMFVLWKKFKLPGE